MTHPERRDRQMAYKADGAVGEEMTRARQVLQRFNIMDRTDTAGLIAVARELLQTEESPVINPPFFCDYGNHIRWERTSLRIITVRFWMLEKSPSVITVCWHPMWRSIQRVIRSIRTAETAVMNTEWMLPSETMYGSAVMW